jgi:ABC-type microcin C transport system duplicated ATPase subunit YejF
MAVLLITHDLNMVKKISEHVHIMHDGRIVENGSTEAIFSSPQDPYTIHLLNSETEKSFLQSLTCNAIFP